LPAAIAAPTPVSSLVHSSTLVTAGVYLIFRFENLLILLNINTLLLGLGCLTIFIARLRAFFEIDIKKIVALSTLRQLGVIITRLGAGFRILGFFHLLSHAFFKALLFIRAGNLIHRSNTSL
jgi:NADH-ubiquinone oxidoreductase chain 5